MKGLSIIQVLISLGLVSIVLLLSSSFFDFTNRQIAWVSAKSEFSDSSHLINKTISQMQNCRETFLGYPLPEPTGTPTIQAPFIIPQNNQTPLDTIKKYTQTGPVIVAQVGQVIGRTRLEQMSVNKIFHTSNRTDPSGVVIGQTVLINFQLTGSLNLLGQSKSTAYDISLLVLRDSSTGQISDCLSQVKLDSSTISNILTCPQLSDGVSDPSKFYFLTGFDNEGRPTCREVSTVKQIDPGVVVNNIIQPKTCREASGEDPGQYVAGVDSTGKLICAEFPPKPPLPNCVAKVKYIHPPKICSNYNGDKCTTPYVPETDSPLAVGWNISATAAGGGCSVGCASGYSYCYGNSWNGICPATGAFLHPPQGTFNYSGPRISGVHEACLVCYPENIPFTVIECT